MVDYWPGSNELTHRCYVMMFVSYCVFHNICILLDVFFEFQIHR